MTDHDTFTVRPRREVPRPRHPRPSEGHEEPAQSSTADWSEAAASSPTEVLPAEPSQQPARRRTVARPSSTEPPPMPATAAPPVTTPTDPLANLAVRVRRPLDKRLGSLVYRLGENEVRTSKAELVEMLLWELPPEPTDDFRRRLATFRRAAPRETPA
jgi:hypothetical protein